MTNKSNELNLNIIDELIVLKKRYFGSPFFSLKNWKNFAEVEFPEGLTLEDIEGWTEEKQAYLSQSKVAMDGIQQAYEKLLIDRLDTASALQLKIISQLKEIEGSQDAQRISRALKTVAELQDEAMGLLKVDSFTSNLYDMNKASTDNLLKEKRVKKASL